MESDDSDEDATQFKEHIVRIIRLNISFKCLVLKSFHRLCLKLNSHY